MYFAAFNDQEKELQEMTDVLLALFPGSMVYKYKSAPSLLEGMHDHGFDAVLLRVSARMKGWLGLLGRIRELDAATQLVVCADSDRMLEDAMWNGASAFLVEPLKAEDIRAAMFAAKDGGR